MRRKLVVLAGVVVLVIGIVGFAAAALPSTQAGRIAQACTNSKHVLSLIKSGSCPTGAHKVTLSTQGGPGMALGYAHIAPGGTLDKARSWRVSSSNVVASGGFYCFRGLPFTPRSAAVTADYNGLLNGQIPAVEIQLPPDKTDCGLSKAPQFEVFTGLVNPGVFTSGADFGFYIVFF